MGMRIRVRTGAWIYTRASARTAELWRNGPGSHKPHSPKAGLLRVALAGPLLALVICASTAGAAGAAQFDISGEWAYTLTCSCGQNGTGTMLITETDPTSGTFSGTTLLDGVIPITVSGTVSGSSLSCELVARSVPPNGEELRFLAPSAVLETGKAEFSGAGTYSLNGDTGEIKAQRVRTLEQIEKEEEEVKKRAEEEKAKQEEATIKEEKQQQEKVAAEQHEREAKAEQEAKEKQANEAKEHEAKQLAEEAATEKHAKEVAEQEAKNKQTSTVTKLFPVQLTGKTLVLSATGTVSLDLKNTNTVAVSGNITLSDAVAASSTAKTHSKPKPSALGAASFNITAQGMKTVKVKLARSAVVALAHSHTLHLAIKVRTSTAGGTAVVKTYDVTLTAVSHSQH